MCPILLVACPYAAGALAADGHVESSSEPCHLHIDAAVVPCATALRVADVARQEVGVGAAHTGGTTLSLPSGVSVNIQMPFKGV